MNIPAALNTFAFICATTFLGQAALLFANDPVPSPLDKILELRVSDISTTFTSRQNRAELVDREMRALNAKFALDPDSAEAEKEWGGALWTVSVFQREFDGARKLLAQGLPRLPGKSDAYQRGILTGAYMLFPGEYREEIKAALPEIKTPREFAIAAYALLQGNREAETLAHIKEVMVKSFPEWSSEPRLIALAHRLENDPKQEVSSRPPLVDLLRHPIREGYPTLFSFQRVNRTFPGLALIRDSRGQFVRLENGTLFNVTHLANARTNLPGTITNGNSPQGVYAIRGTGLAKNKFIGPTPYLYSQVPVEASPAAFEHRTAAENDNPWTTEMYLSFLPESWRNYFPMQEAWLAGQAGRSEMLCHGTTIDQEYYQGMSYYPHTPSAGCLCTKEFWDENGDLVYSDQLALLQAFVRAGGENGYLVVVELDDQQKPVTLDDVIDQILKAEQKSE